VLVTVSWRLAYKTVGERIPADTDINAANHVLDEPKEPFKPSDCDDSGFAARVLTAASGRKFFETRDILKALGVPIKGKSQAESFKIAKMLKAEGFERVQKSICGRPTWGWSPPYHARHI